jgi:hypothetical protein
MLKDNQPAILAPAICTFPEILIQGHFIIQQLFTILLYNLDGFFSLMAKVNAVLLNIFPKIRRNFFNNKYLLKANKKILF